MAREEIFALGDEKTARVLSLAVAYLLCLCKLICLQMCQFFDRMFMSCLFIFLTNLLPFSLYFSLVATYASYPISICEAETVIRLCVNFASASGCNGLTKAFILFCHNQARTGLRIRCGYIENVAFAVS